MKTAEEWRKEHDVTLVAAGPYADYAQITDGIFRRCQHDAIDACECKAEFFPTVCEECSGCGEVGHRESMPVCCPSCEGCGHKFHHQIPKLIANKLRALKEA